VSQSTLFIHPLNKSKNENKSISDYQPLHDAVRRQGKCAVDGREIVQTSTTAQNMIKNCAPVKVIW